MNGLEINAMSRMSPINPYDTRATSLNLAYDTYIRIPF